MFNLSNKFKKMLVCSMTAMSLVAGSSTAMAQVIQETTTFHGSPETAQEINANYETAAEAASGRRTGQVVVKGKSISGVKDYYKVHLKAGTQFMTCNNKAFKFNIKDSNNTSLISETFYGTGLKAYEFDVSKEGDYYIDVEGVSSGEADYLFLIGSPTYYPGEKKIEANGYVYLNKRGDTDYANFNGTNTDIPKEAITSSIMFIGVGASDAKYITLKNMSSGRSFDVNPLTRGKDKLISMNMPANSVWRADFTYQSKTSFKPILKVAFFYPVTDTVYKY